MYKKAAEKRALMILIISLVICIFLSVLIIRWKTMLSEESESQICEQSNRISAMYAEKGIKIDTEIKCPTLYIKVPEGKEFEATADAMDKTWKEFLEGQKQVFILEEQNFCVLRRVLEYEKKEKLNGFFEFLTTDTVKGKGISHYEYYTGTQVKDQERITIETSAADDILDTNYGYAVVFMLNKEPYWDRVMRGATGGIAGVVISGGVLLIASGVGLPAGVAFLVIGGGVGFATGFVTSPEESANWYPRIILLPYTQESIASLHCTFLPSTQT